MQSGKKEEAVNRLYDLMHKVLADELECRMWMHRARCAMEDGAGCHTGGGGITPRGSGRGVGGDRGMLRANTSPPQPACTPSSASPERRPPPSAPSDE